MSERMNNKALVRRIYEDMWNKHDPDAAIQLFASPEGVHHYVFEFLIAFPDLQHTIEDMLAEGDRVVARFSARGTHTGQWEGWAPTGKSIHYTGITLARIENGEIIEHHTWWDRWELVAQINGDKSTWH